MAWVAVCLVSIRLALVSQTTPAFRADTPRYLDSPVSFIGRSSQPWVLPLMYDVLGSAWAVVTIQTVLSAVAFVALAVTVAGTMRDQRVRVVTLGVILLMGLSPRVIIHDNILLSEAPAIALTALLIAAMIRFHRSPWVALTVFTLWIFTRDAHVLLGVGVAVIAVYVAWRTSQRGVAVGFALVAVWAFGVMQVDRHIEASNVITVVVYRADAELLSAFRDAGMPDSPALALEDQAERSDALRADPGFREWAGGDGVRAYTRWIVARPVESTTDTLDAVFAPDGAAFTGIGTLDRGVGVVFPRYSFTLTGVLLGVAGVIALRLARCGRIGRRWVLPAGVLFSALPHAALVHLGSAIELDRHAVLLGFVLMLSVWWLLLTLTDQGMTPVDSTV